MLKAVVKLDLRDRAISLSFGIFAIAGMSILAVCLSLSGLRFMKAHSASLHPCVSTGTYRGAEEYSAACTLVKLEGYDISPKDIVENTVMGKKDFVYHYRGDIFSDGSVWPQGLTIFSNLTLNSTPIRLQNISRTSWSELRERNRPFAAWVTKDFEYPDYTGEESEGERYYSNSYVVCVTAIDDREVTYVTPQEVEKIDVYTFKTCWEACGQLGVETYKL